MAQVNVMKAEPIDLAGHLERYGMKHCPIDNSINILGKKYALHIMRNMTLLKQSRFNQFLKSIEGINTKTLSMRLKEMERFGLISRRILSRHPIEVEYSLTDKGRSLEPLLVFLANYSMKFEPKVIFPDNKPRNVKQVFGTEILSKVYD